MIQGMSMVGFVILVFLFPVALFSVLTEGSPVAVGFIFMFLLYLWAR